MFSSPAIIKAIQALDAPTLSAVKGVVGNLLR